MIEAHPYCGREPYVVHLPASLRLNRKQFAEVCRLNREARFELSAEGDLLIMPPTGALTGVRNMRVSRQLSQWSDRDSSGVAFDSSTGFELPNGATRAPDAAWATKTRLQGFTRDQWESFLPVCPDFVIEIRSPSDLLVTLQEKMVEYISNGTRLGWLIDPPAQFVHVYRPHANVERVSQPRSLSADPELPGFVLDLSSIWEPTDLLA